MLEMAVKALVHINLGTHLFPALMLMIIIYSIILHENYIGWYVDNELKHFITPSSFSGGFEWLYNTDHWYIILNHNY